MNKQKIIIVLLYGVLIVTTLWAPTTEAQVLDERWSQPYRLSSKEGNVLGGGGELVADQYGYVHTFWAEGGFSDARIIIQYARFDGEAWSDPIDIWVSKPDSTFGFISAPTVDKNGTLHLAWSMGVEGPVLYMHAPAHDALSAKSWSDPIRVDAPAHKADLRVDSAGILHLVYNIDEGNVSGVYYIRSEDQGENWSDPVSLDPAMPGNYTTIHISFVLDPANDNLHVIWKNNEAIDEDISVSKEIRYAHSLDGGQNWSIPFTIDAADEDPDELRAGALQFTAYNKIVHVVWAGTETTHREHRYSTDAGRTWSVPFRIFGGLSGSAGDVLVIDGAGRMHFLGQIRFPQGLYNIIWDKDHWSPPSLVYVIRYTSEEEHQGIHVHAVRAGVRLDNQLVTLFTNSPAESQIVLYTIHRTFDEISPAQTIPTPVPTATPTATLRPSPTPTLSSTPEATRLSANAQVDLASNDSSGPAQPIWLGLTPSLLLIGGVIAFRMLQKKH